MASTAFSGYPWRPAKRPQQPGILHLGLGNFHRAHQAVYTARALEREPGPWGIVGTASRSRRVVEPMRAQDGKYSVLTLSPQGTSADVFQVHTDLLVAAEQPDELTGYIADARIRLVTLTVSENGYTYSHKLGGLDMDSPAVAADLRGEVPSTVIGQLVRGLRERYRASGAQIAIVSCDNLNENGKLTASLVEEFLERSSDADADHEFPAWIAGNVVFPSTMVDRIVPSTEEHHRDLSEQITGTRDLAPVPAEPFTMWVLEDRFAAGRPAWEHSGAIFTDDVRAYELVKLRILNSSNSLLSYLGLLSGNAYIADGLANPRMRPVVEQMMRNEMLPTLTVPEGIEIDDYIEQLFSRFGNRPVGHRTSQVASDGSTKLPVRVTKPVLLHHAQGRVPRVTALLVASYIQTFCDPLSYPADVTGRPTDPGESLLSDLGERHPDSGSLVAAVIGDSGIFPPTLSEASPWIETVAELHGVLRKGGVDAAIDAALHG